MDERKIVCSDRSIGTVLFFLLYLFLELVLVFLLREDMMKSFQNRDARGYIVFFGMYSLIYLYLVLGYFNKKIEVSDNGLKYTTRLGLKYSYQWSGTKVYRITGRAYGIVFVFKDLQVNLHTTSKGFYELEDYLFEKGLLEN